jgi:murein DD-endopeptidase MepM/ murein hydrolase activator NlpD
MAKKKFHFNPETLNYEPIDHTIAHKLKNFLFHVLTAVFSGAIFFFLFVFIVDSPKEKQLAQEKEKLQVQYKVLDRQLDEIQAVLTSLQERDENLYRVVFQADPIPNTVRTAIASESDYYENLSRATNSQIVSATTKKLNQLKKQLYIQSKSYDEIVDLAKNKEEMLECIPAIQPVLNKDLKRMASGYGWRIDPVYHIPRHHDGMDFTAPTGTDVYATGKGKVIRAGWAQGYGNCIDIDHGYNYVSRYAHLYEIHVKRGQEVKRGEIIGLVGSTGKSVGPHLHYEVIYKGSPQNPQNYYYLDLSPEEYDRMVQMSNNAGQALD